MCNIPIHRMISARLRFAIYKYTNIYVDTQTATYTHTRTTTHTHTHTHPYTGTHTGTHIKHIMYVIHTLIQIPTYRYTCNIYLLYIFKYIKR